MKIGLSLPCCGQYERGRSFGETEYELANSVYLPLPLNMPLCIERLATVGAAVNGPSRGSDLASHDWIELA